MCGQRRLSSEGLECQDVDVTDASPRIYGGTAEIETAEIETAGIETAGIETS